MNDRICKSLACRSFGNFAAIDILCRRDDAALRDRLAFDLADVCEQIAWDEKVRVVVLSFDGDVCVPAQDDPDRDDLAERRSFVDPVAGLKLPVIAAIRGDAAGPGLELALACDIRIGTENARFGLTQIRYGRMPCDGGTQRLPRLVGRGKAMQMILTGEMVDAGEACRCGLINRVVPSQHLADAAAGLAREMAEKSPLSLCYAKEAIHKGLDLTLDQGLGLEIDLYLHLFATSDRTEGIKAFTEKRKPKFEGA